MTDYHGALETGKGQPDVFDYIADFRNAADWDPATVNLSQTSGTGAGLGSRYRLVTRFLGRSVALDYETIAYKPLDELVLGFEGGSVRGTDTIAVTRNDGKTRLVYSVDFQLKLRWLEPLAVPFFNLAADRALVGLARALEGAVVAV